LTTTTTTTTIPSSSSLYYHYYYYNDCDCYCYYDYYCYCYCYCYCYFGLFPSSFSFFRISTGLVLLLSNFWVIMEDAVQERDARKLAEPIRQDPGFDVNRKKKKKR